MPVTPPLARESASPAAATDRNPCVLLVDDHMLFRAGLALILSDAHAPPCHLVQAGNLTQALSVPHAVQVVLLDVELPGVSGIDGLAAVRRRWPLAAIIVLSANDSSLRVAQALQRGANLFVSKAAAPDHIRRVVAQGLRDGHQLGLTADGATPPDAPGDKAAAPDADLPQAATLSARQIEVLALLCEGLSNKGIANRLGLSENTVRNHVVGVLRYFDANTRTEAVMAAQRAGVVRMESPT